MLSVFLILDDISAVMTELCYLYVRYLMAHLLWFISIICLDYTWWCNYHDYL